MLGLTFTFDWVRPPAAAGPVPAAPLPAACRAAAAGDTRIVFHTLPADFAARPRCAVRFGDLALVDGFIARLGTALGRDGIAIAVLAASTAVERAA